MQRGYGIAYNQPADPEYLGDFESIDPTRIYCGNKEALPLGYDRMGTNGECLRKGYGAGKRKKAIENAGGDSDSSPEGIVFAGPMINLGKKGRKKGSKKAGKKVGKKGLKKSKK